MIVTSLALFLLAKQCVGEANSGLHDGLYVWGPQFAQPLTRRQLTIGGAPEISFIDLLYGQSVLAIHAVQRGTDWQEHKSFCSHMLPAAIRDYLDRKDNPPVGEIWAVNMAEPSIAGCICYVRTMVEFGMGIVNDTAVSDVRRFCATNDHYGAVLVGKPVPGSRFTKGVSTNAQTVLLKRALLG